MIYGVLLNVMFLEQFILLYNSFFPLDCVRHLGV